MHWWDYNIPGMVDAALALADLRAKGVIRHVGMTNMDTAALAKIVDAGVPVVCNQVGGAPSAGAVLRGQIVAGGAGSRQG